MRYEMDKSRHEAIFGSADDGGDAPGRSRRCRSCGGWHSLSRPWPHNCRPPQIGPRQILAAPHLAPTFHDFLAAPGSDVGEIIGSRNEKREYMRRNGLIEHDSGVGKKNEWAHERDEIADIVDDIKMVDAMDPDRRRKEFGAVEMVEGGSLEDGTEIELGPDE